MIGNRTVRQLAAATAVALSAAALTPSLASAGDANRATCPNETSPGYRSYLPDCRAYEMVTPAYKGGFEITVQDLSEDGSHLLLDSLGTFAGDEDAGKFGTFYEGGRTSSGWAVTPFDVPLTTFPGFEVEAISPDFAKSLWLAETPTDSVIPNFYLGASPRGPFVDVGPSGPASAGERTMLPIGSSQDLSHSFYSILAPSLGGRNELWPGDKTTDQGAPSLYEYAGTNNEEPRLVGVSNGGPPVNIEASNLISECGTVLGGPGFRNIAFNAVSATGGTVYFTALGRDFGNCEKAAGGVVMPSVNELWARVDGALPDAHSVAISEPTAADCSECDVSENQQDANFQGASADGSTVFFTTNQPLLAGPSEEGPELYEYDFAGAEGKRVTRVSAGDPAGSRVKRVLTVADDGSHVYFTAQGVLTTTANVYGAHAEEGAENIYVYERDGAHPTGHLSFIGAGSVRLGQAQTTPDGTFLLFTTSADLTPDEEGREEAGQVFEYNADTGALVRVSRGEAGYNRNGNSSVYAAEIPVKLFGSAEPVTKFEGLAMSADGADVVFTSEDSLTPQAVAGIENVYEYSGGHVALITDGHDFVTVREGPSVELIGTDASGSDVYFMTADPLVEGDTNTQRDVYDARVNGGVPAATVQPRCEGDACQGGGAGTLQTPSAPTGSSGGRSVAGFSRRGAWYRLAAAHPRAASREGGEALPCEAGPA